MPLLAENVEQILGGGERGAPSARLLEEQPGPASAGSWKPAISTPGMAGGDLPLVEGLGKELAGKLGLEKPMEAKTEPP